MLWSSPSLTSLSRCYLARTSCAIMALSLSSCLSLGKNFSMNTDWIEIDRTTQMQVTNTLGVPEEVGVGENQSIWTYYHIQLSLWHKIARKEIRITWNDDLTVHSYNLMQSPVTHKESWLLPASLRHSSKGPPAHSKSAVSQLSLPTKLKTFANQLIQPKTAPPATTTPTTTAEPSAP